MHRLAVRIFSTKDPDGEPVHAKLAKVRAPVTYLSFRRRVRAILLANVRIARRRPGAYARTLLLALRLGRAGVLWRLLQAGYLADLLRRDAVAHLHAHFATGPALVAMLAHELVGIPYSFTAHARDIYVDTPPRLLRAEMEQARAVITVSEYNRRYLLSRISPDSTGKVSGSPSALVLADLTFHSLGAPLPGPPWSLPVARAAERRGWANL